MNLVKPFVTFVVKFFLPRSTQRRHEEHKEINSMAKNNLQKLELTWIGNCLKKDTQDLRINKVPYSSNSKLKEV